MERHFFSLFFDFCVEGKKNSLLWMAKLLKTRVNHALALLDASMHPQLYLFRGNAYMALGQPYFALSDYSLAESLQELSGRHMAACREALEKLRSDVCGQFPACDTHLPLLVEPILGENFAIKEAAHGKGRGIFGHKKGWCG